MAVGAGSIRRAAKANADAVKNVEIKKEAEVVSVEVKEEGVVEKKAAPKKTTPRKTVDKKAVDTQKKSTAAKKVPVTKPVVEASANQVCHITEDLPIYLL